LLYGELAEIVTGSQNAIPARLVALGHSFRHATIDAALAEALS
jgi:NAD dependent epimerase/dehydratase family enzyme